jgi:hypothetical protein
MNGWVCSSVVCTIDGESCRVASALVGRVPLSMGILPVVNFREHAGMRFPNQSGLEQQFLAVVALVSAGNTVGHLPGERFRPLPRKKKR